MSAINRRSLTPLPSCCKTSSEKTRALAAWCMASQAFRSACRSSLKSFSRCRRHIEHDGGKINGGEPPTHRGSDSHYAGSATIVGTDPRKRASRGTPDFLSLDTHRWVSIFYREAGPKEAPTLLLLHGLPSSSR